MPTARKNSAVHTHVMTRPVGKKASAVPGSTKGTAVATRAEAEAAAAAGSVTVGPWAAKTPLTKEASWEVRPALSSGRVREESSIVGMRRGWRISLAGC